MFRSLISIARRFPASNAFGRRQSTILNNNTQFKSFYTEINRNITAFSSNLRAFNLSQLALIYPGTQNKFLQPQPSSLDNQCRSLTKFSLIKGKRKAVKPVIKRFKRLNWGIWIRTRTGRHKKLFKKSTALKKRLKQHVFVNGTQSWLLDSMVTNYWRKPRHYIDDPYEQYHVREEYFATRQKPIDYKK